jgi:hypothetical protein
LGRICEDNIDRDGFPQVFSKAHQFWLLFQQLSMLPASTVSSHDCSATSESNLIVQLSFSAGGKCWIEFVFRRIVVWTITALHLDVHRYIQGRLVNPGVSVCKENKWVRISDPVVVEFKFMTVYSPKTHWIFWIFENCSILVWKFYYEKKFILEGVPVHFSQTDHLYCKKGLQS